MIFSGRQRSATWRRTGGSPAWECQPRGTNGPVRPSTRCVVYCSWGHGVPQDRARFGHVALGQGTAVQTEGGHAAYSSRIAMSSRLRVFGTQDSHKPGAHPVAGVRACEDLHA